MTGIIFVGKDGNLICRADKTRLKNAKWYQKTLAFFSKKYRYKFIDLKPYPCTIINNK